MVEKASGRKILVGLRMKKLILFVIFSFLLHLPAQAMVGPDGRLIQRPGSAQRMGGEVGDRAYIIDLPSVGAAAQGMEFDEGLIKESQVDTLGNSVYSWKLQKLQASGSAAKGVPGQFPVKIFLQKKDLDGKIVAEEELAEWRHDSGAVIDKRRIPTQTTFPVDLEAKLKRLDVMTSPHNLKAKIQFILNSDGVLLGTLACRIVIGELPDYFLDNAFTSKTVAAYQNTKDFEKFAVHSPDAVKHQKILMTRGEAEINEYVAGLLKQGKFFLAAGTVEEAAQLDAAKTYAVGRPLEKTRHRSAVAWHSVISPGLVSGASYVFDHLSNSTLTLGPHHNQTTFLVGTAASVVTGSLHDYFARRGWIKGRLKSSTKAYLWGGILASCTCECILRLLH